MRMSGGDDDGDGDCSAASVCERPQRRTPDDHGRDTSGTRKPPSDCRKLKGAPDSTLLQSLSPIP